MLFIVALACLSGAGSTAASGLQTAKPFTVADEIGLTALGNPERGPGEVRFSPDGNYFAVWSERGRLDLDRPEDSLRFYAVQDIKNFLEHSDESLPPSPVWVVNRSTSKEGPIIDDWRWLADSSGVAFLERTASGHQHLVLADLRKKTIEPLTSATETVRAFDIRDPKHYVYTVLDPAQRDKLRAEHQAAAIVGLGRPLIELLFPDNPSTAIWHSPCNKLWAVVGGKRFEVKHDKTPLVPIFSADLALSPDGSSLVTTLPVPEVPSPWETLYPPSFQSSPDRIRAGHQGSVGQYVLINLRTGSVDALTEAPVGRAAGWGGGGRPSWSRDGKAILLPGTFVKSIENTPSRPCVAVVDVQSNSRTCVEMLRGLTETGLEEGYHLIRAASFSHGDRDRVMVTFIDHQDQSYRANVYRRPAGGIWQVAEQGKAVSEVGLSGLEVAVKQGLNEPPRLVATSEQRSRLIWDPNPMLKDTELGQASVYKWKDKEGREWRGGLYKPIGYKPGRRYPLVIQTHGFAESVFSPSGIYPTAFAARALAAAGMMVLQVGDLKVCIPLRFYEGSCAVYGYEAAIDQLSSDGLVDPEKVGIIGFSRTCYYVMEALTTRSLHLRAASVTDGVMENYVQYIVFGEPGNGIANDANSRIGTQPFGEGLTQWLRRSPGFNLDKVSVPLMVVAEGPVGLLGMWEAYAGLRYLGRPVDLVMLNTDEHVLTNPAVRLVSQGGTVDWFRFWLKDEEDPDPAKAEQYMRWREMKKLQEENQHKFTSPQSASN